MPPEWGNIEVDVYGIAGGDPYVIDRGYSHVNILAKSYKGASFSRKSNNVPHLEWIDDIGLVARPQIVIKDTLFNRFTINDGDFDQVRPVSGSENKYRLRHYNGNPGETFDAQGLDVFPARHHFAFELFLPETPEGWDYPGMAPFVRIEFGNGAWGIYLSNTECFLLRRNAAGVLIAVDQLRQPAKRIGWIEQDAIWVFVRNLYGKVAVSTDFGDDYTIYEDDTMPLVVPEGRVRLVGQGGIVEFGNHQILYNTGYMDEAPQDSLTQRISSASVLTGEYEIPGSSSISFSDISAYPTRYMQGRATLNPGINPFNTSPPFTSYATPVLGVMSFRIPVTIQNTSNDVTQPFAGKILGCDIDEPEDIGAGTCILYLHSDLQNLFTLFDWRWRKISVRMSFGAETPVTVFTGYTRSIEIEESPNNEFKQAFVTLICDNAAIRFKRATWDPFHRVYFGGMFPNDAADYILASEGLNASYRAWNILGNFGRLPKGSFDYPFGMTRDDEAKWKTLQRIFAHRDLEIGVARDGTFLTLPMNYVDSVVGWDLHPDQQVTVDQRKLMTSFRNIFNSMDHATAVLVTGYNTETGRGRGGNRAVYAWAVDSQAEINPASGRFCRWRELIQENLNEPATLSVLGARAQTIAYDTFNLRKEPEAEIPCYPEMLRKMRVQIMGENLGDIAPGTELKVSTVNHSMRNPRGQRIHATTAIGLRRI